MCNATQTHTHIHENRWINIKSILTCFGLCNQSVRGCWLQYVSNLWTEHVYTYFFFFTTFPFTAVGRDTHGARIEFILYTQKYLCAYTFGDLIVTYLAHRYVQPLFLWSFRVCVEFINKNRNRKKNKTVLCASCLNSIELQLPLQ